MTTAAKKQAEAAEATESLRDSLSTAFEEDEQGSTADALRGEDGAGEEDETQPPATGEDDDDTSTDDDDAGDDAAETGDKTGEEDTGEEGEDDGEEENEPDEYESPPQSWSQDSKAKWKDLPKDLRAQITKREHETSNTLNQTAQIRQFATNFQRAVQPFAGYFKAQGVEPLQGIYNTLQIANTLQTGTQEQKAAAAAQVIKDFGVDVRTLDSILAGKTQPAPAPQQQQPAQRDPEIEQLRDYVHSQRQREQQLIRQETDDFLEKTPFAKELRMEMADFIDLAESQGRQMSLKDAYDRALALRPDLRERLEANKRKQSSKTAIQRKKKAASSLPPSNAYAAAPPQPKDSIRGALEDAINQNSS